MFRFFKPKKEPEVIEQAQKEAPDVSAMSEAKQLLFEQLKAKRDELGPDTVEKIQKAVEMESLKKKIKQGIDTDGSARQRLIDEIRFQMQDK